MAKRNQTAPKTFEEAVAELEQILARIEGGELGLEESLSQYERGSFLIQHCRGVLNSAQKQIEVVMRNGEAGEGGGAQMAAPEEMGETGGGES